MSRRSHLLPWVLALVLLAGCDDSPKVPEDFAGDCESTPRQRMLFLVNRERELVGQPVLAAETRLAEAAQTHAVNMARNGVLTPLTTELPVRLGLVGYPDTWSWAGVAAGSFEAEVVFSAWMNGQDAVETRERILSPDFEHLGVGYAENLATPLGYYWVLILGSSSDPGHFTAGGCHP